MQKKIFGGVRVKYKRSIMIIIGLVALIGGIIYISNQNSKTGSGSGDVPGQLTLHDTEFPKSFNAYVNPALDATAVFRLVYDTLIELDPNTLEYRPLIAESMIVSSDKKAFTFKIDSRAKWSDGKPITVQDVKFTYDTIMNSQNMTSVMRLYMGRFNPPEILDKDTIKFSAKTPHFKYLETFARDFFIIPKHLYENKDFNKDFNMSLPGASGPYILSEVKEGRYYVLSRRKDYWADQLTGHQGTFNFSRIKYKIIRDENVAFEAFKKGDFDIFTTASGKRWVTETDSEPFKKNWIVKQKIYNYLPRGFGGIALNLRNPLLNNLKVRQALFYLLDRKTMLEKLDYNQFKPLSSYFSLPDSNHINEIINYDPVKARQLLKEAGFDHLDKDGFLINSKGQRLEFAISYASDAYEKHLTIFADNCKQAGVKVNLELLSWATLIKKMDEYKFDAVVIFWSNDYFPDPAQLWHSKHLNEIGGSNLCGYSNPEVDQLIDSLAPIYDTNQRNQIIKKIDRILYKDTPYLLFWGIDHAPIMYKNVFSMPKTVFPKYFTGSVKYWRFDLVKYKEYREAVNKRKSLPPVPPEVYYDKEASK